eukprot:GHUV01030415.1.p2 GENE.GHUV01030415.1~~GHUV01030415.1.p2  ORF type:complete len:124 (+),score=14.38 GHUV01030415.1:413-784(+)
MRKACRHCPISDDLLGVYKGLEPLQGNQLRISRCATINNGTCKHMHMVRKDDLLVDLGGLCNLPQMSTNTLTSDYSCQWAAPVTVSLVRWRSFESNILCKDKGISSRGQHGKGSIMAHWQQLR